MRNEPISFDGHDAPATMVVFVKPQRIQTAALAVLFAVGCSRNTEPRSQPPDYSADPDVVVVSTIDRGADPTFDWASHPYPYQPVVALSNERTLAMTLIGSSSCRQRPTKLKVLDAHAVRITIDYPYGANATCTADAAPMTYVMKLEDELDRGADVRVQIVGSSGGETSLVVKP